MRKVIDTSPADTVRRITKVGRYHLALFLLPAASLLFYGWLRAPHLNERPDNPHRVAPLHLRGRILDRNNVPLAEVKDGSRIYRGGASTGALVGYYLMGRNQSGLEAALQDELSPPLPPASLGAAIRQDREAEEGRPRLRGPDVRLTLDSELQKEIFDLLEGMAGAVVIADRKGRILAAVSTPSFDSNRVREDWQKLRSDPSSPFIERVGSGLYPVTAPNGETLFSRQALRNHAWMSGNPFPGYPLSSSALITEDRVLLTPLMLLETAFWLSNVSPVPQLHLLEQSSPGQGNSELQTTLGAGRPTEAWQLGGPAFQESPEFEVVVGTVEEKLFYALVIEEKSKDALRVPGAVLKNLKQVVGEREL